VILLADGLGGNNEGIQLTQAAMSFHLGGFGGHFIAMAITFFGFTSIVANYAYAESNLHFFKLDNKPGKSAFTIVFLGMIFFGTQIDLAQMWATADMAFGFMTVINVIAILSLSATVVSVAQHYNDEVKGKSDQEERVFNKNDCDIQGESEKGIW